MLALLLVLALGACVGDSARPPADAAPHAPKNNSGPIHSETIHHEPSHLIDPSAQPPSGGSPPPAVDLAGDLDHDEMIGLGELGALPGLLDSFAPSPDCDFDEPLSSCQ